MSEALEVFDHTHIYGTVEYSRMSGNPYRACTRPFCKAISLDLEEESEENIASWDTLELCRWIDNDPTMYDLATEADDEEELEEIVRSLIAEGIPALEYLDIDLDNVNWDLAFYWSVEN